MLTIEIFKAFWQKVSPDSLSLTIEAGDEASYNEWEDEDGNKNQGMRKPDNARHGIVRTIRPGRWISEETYCNDERHGLSFFWYEDVNYCAFMARIYNYGQLKACIAWKSDWSRKF